MAISQYKPQSYRPPCNAGLIANYLKMTTVLRDSFCNGGGKMELDIYQKKMELYPKEVQSMSQIKNGSFVAWYITLVVFGFVLVVSSFVIFLTRRRFQTEQHLKKEPTMKGDERPRGIHRTNLQLRLALNRAHVNSHFVFNVLNSIRYMVLQNEPLQASNHLAKLSSLMRYALETSELEGVPVRKELDMLEQYIQLEKTRLNDKFTYSITADVGDNILIPGMLIQPYVENAIIHGLAPVEGNDLYLSLRVKQVDDVLRVEIEDNGKGKSAARSNDHTPVGASLGADRLHILSLLNNKSYSVYAKDLDDSRGDRKGTLVILEVPIV
jgi:hypothetical protein